jgi:hypothetical protein
LKLNEKHIAKTDPLLEDRLKHAREDENIRAVMVLGPEEPTGSIHKQPHPSQFPSRQAWRETLVKQRKGQIEGEIGGTLKQLRELSLNPQGGKIGQAVVVEGPAANIASSLDLPGVHHASLDREIALSKSTAD